MPSNHTYLQTRRIMDKPTTATGYAPEMVDLVRKTLLYNEREETVQADAAGFAQELLRILNP